MPAAWCWVPIVVEEDAKRLHRERKRLVREHRSGAGYGGRYAPLECRPGKDTRDGSDVAAMIVRIRRNNCPVVDCGGGWGAAAVGAMERNGIPAIPYLGSKPSMAPSKDGPFRFFNKRAEDWWRKPEELDPDQEFGSPRREPL